MRKWGKGCLFREMKITMQTACLKCCSQWNVLLYTQIYTFTYQMQHHQPWLAHCRVETLVCFEWRNGLFFHSGCVGGLCLWFAFELTQPPAIRRHIVGCFQLQKESGLIRGPQSQRPAAPLHSLNGLFSFCCGLCTLVWWLCGSQVGACLHRIS